MLNQTISITLTHTYVLCLAGNHRALTVSDWEQGNYQTCSTLSRIPITNSLLWYRWRRCIIYEQKWWRGGEGFLEDSDGWNQCSVQPFSMDLLSLVWVPCEITEGLQLTVAAIRTKIWVEDLMVLTSISKAPEMACPPPLHHPRIIILNLRPATFSLLIFRHIGHMDNRVSHQLFLSRVYVCS